ncbi:MAG: hypothetical protein IPN07_02915 [Dehalococcoidia bacterium]|nr:hypothetical protein [Dehalococcoidia bacterium]
MLEELLLLVGDIPEHVGEFGGGFATGLLLAALLLAALFATLLLCAGLLLALLPLWLLALLPLLSLGLLTPLLSLGLLAALLRLITLLALLAGLAVRFIEPAVERALFHADDFFELAFQVIEDRREVEAIELLAALLPELLEEVAKALHAVALGAAHAPLKQVPKGVLQVAEIHQVVGEVIEDVIRFERGHLLGAIPHRIAISQRHLASTRPPGWAD